MLKDTIQILQVENKHKYNYWAHYLNAAFYDWVKTSGLTLSPSSTQTSENYMSYKKTDFYIKVSWKKLHSHLEIEATLKLESNKLELPNCVYFSILESNFTLSDKSIEMVDINVTPNLFKKRLDFLVSNLVLEAQHLIELELKLKKEMSTQK